MLVTKYRSRSASYLTDSGVLNPSTVSTRVAVAAADCCGLRPQDTARVASPSRRKLRVGMCIEARVVTATPPLGREQLVKPRARRQRTLETWSPGAPQGPRGRRGGHGAGDGLDDV